MPSGKQILLAEIQRLSQTRLPHEELIEATERFRAGLLLHGSTADSAWPTVERVGWIGREEGIQGPGLVAEKIYLIELLNALGYEQSIPESVQEKFPDLSLRAYRAGLHVIGLLISQLYFFDVCEPAENGGDIDKEAADKLVKGYIAKLHAYRENPEGYLGCPVELVEKEI